MVRLTDQATDHLARVRRERDLDTKAMPRFSRRDGRLFLSFADTPAEGDRLVHAGSISALVAGDIAPSLEAALIDAASKDGRTYLVLRRAPEGGAPRARRGRSRPTD